MPKADISIAKVTARVNRRQTPFASFGKKVIGTNMVTSIREAVIIVLESLRTVLRVVRWGCTFRLTPVVTVLITMTVLLIIRFEVKT